MGFAGEDTGRVYAGLCLDYNPIHMYSWSARIFGFRAAIVHGMCLLEKALPQLLQTCKIIHGTELTVSSDVGGVVGRLRLRVAFRKPVFLPSTVQTQTFTYKDGTTTQTAFVIKNLKGDVCQLGDVAVH